MSMIMRDSPQTQKPETAEFRMTRLVEPVPGQEEGKRLGVGGPFGARDESRIGDLGQRALGKWNGFDRGDIGEVSPSTVAIGNDRFAQIAVTRRPFGERVR